MQQDPRINEDFFVSIDTELSLAGASVNMYYRKPGASKETTLAGASTTGTGSSVRGQITDTINDTTGRWLFRVRVIAAGGNIYFTPAAHVNVRSSYHPYL